ncbi:MAG TPA: tRNA (N6-isopentenyl adenosine(37)-C2)-methylthiotransferase MiaB [Candidatus Krumholzibacteria bacterium]|nr:tRNA (N6-isopentenyl adenosine(37)-C2)-methylthiotransferase MiaB [Candidatus Krumholzibacteria bacterium]HRX52049.1 tRNA (N6-isopentenyl adenosine(37)-C2)-methylthiotransferase MiaB [Candidatus Krumholzibacteria bacterium]
MSDVARIWIETYGCQMNSYDTAAMYGILSEHGYRRADFLAEADVVILNTCSVRDLAEHKVESRIGELRSFHRKGETQAAVVGITGCMAERLADDLAKGPNRADLVLGVDQYGHLPAMVEKALVGSGREKLVSTGHRDDVHYVAPPEAMPTNNSHLVTIHKGCDYKCTYCIVPATRGPQREKAPQVIADEIRAIVDAGGGEVTLLGQNVTAYRAPEMDFAGLLRFLAPIPGLERIRFLTGHPCDMTPDLIRTVGELDTVCPWLHVPAQSGSDRVLRRMKRHYTSDDYLRMVDLAREHIPDVTFSGDFIVGFPGETDEDFRLTLELVRAVGYDQIFSFKYSERPDTPAARLEDDVPLRTKKERLGELLALQEGLWAERAAACVGQEWTIALEEPARRPDGAWRGRTANNRKVLLLDHEGAVGRTLRVRVTGWEATTFVGEPI